VTGGRTNKELSRAFKHKTDELYDERVRQNLPVRSVSSVSLSASIGVATRGFSGDSAMRLTEPNFIYTPGFNNK
jgi:hypothetical protein